MKKTIFILILKLVIVFGASSQTAAGPIDLVVVLDTSASMSTYHWETSDYLIGPFLREFLRIGDTFHLISFAETPRMEISRRIEGLRDVETIIARLLLMYPLGGQANPGPALSFAENYISALPGNRPRRLVLISDGSAPGTESAVNAASGRLRNMGAELQFIRVPVAGDGPAGGRPPVAVAQPPGVQPPVVAQPPGLQPPVTQPPGVQPPVTQPPGVQPPVTQPPGVQPPVTQPPGVQPPVTQPPGVQPPVTQPPGVQPPVAQPPGIQPPVDQPPGVQPPVTQPPGVQPPVDQPPGVQPPVAQPPGVQPPAAQPPGVQPPVDEPPGVQPPVAQPPGVQPPVTQPPGVQPPVAQPPAPRERAAAEIPPWLIIVLVILALAILGLIIFFAARKLHSSPNRAMAQATRSPREVRNDAELMGKYAQTQKSQTRHGTMPKDKVYSPFEEGPMMLNLFVEDQNTAIGRRNIHSVKAGNTFSVGGGKSDFLIFLVPIPPHIADLQFDGKNCTFIPRKPQYFPDIGSEPVHNCIGKTIRVISDKNYELFIRVERYEDPLKTLNRLLNSISVPGEVNK